MNKLLFVFVCFFIFSTFRANTIQAQEHIEKKSENPWASYLSNSIDSVKQIYFANQDVNKTLFQSPSNDGYVNFNLAQGLHQNPVGDRYNPTIYLGFNVLDGGTREVEGEAQVFDSWEQHYVFEEGKTLLERHWCFGGENGNHYRPISSSMQVENEWVDLSFCADKINFFSKDYSTRYLILQAIGSLILQNKSIAHDINDNYAYRINQTLPATKEIQITYAMGGSNKWYQRVLASNYDYSIYNSTWGHVIYMKNSDGNVGIGKNNPMAKLDVNGGIRSKTLQIGDSTVYITKQKYIRHDTLFEVVNTDTFYMLKKVPKSGDSSFPGKETCGNVLMQNYPNPAFGSTRIEFGLANYGHVELSIYNTLGQKVKNLINEDMSPGYHVSVWDGSDKNGNKVSAGVYIYKLEAGEYKAVQKMIMVK